jgi:hypothetical protein
MDTYPVSDSLTISRGNAPVLSIDGGKGLSSSIGDHVPVEPRDRTSDLKSATSTTPEFAANSERTECASLVGYLIEPLDRFFEVLNNIVDDEVVSAARADLRQPQTSEDEAAALDALVLNAVCETTPAAAATIAAALAARTFAGTVFGSRALQQLESEALVGAWIETARAIVDVRGPEGLMRLLPAARRLALRSLEKEEPVAAIADAMRRVAARITADPASGRPAERASAKRARESARAGANGVRRRSAFECGEEVTLSAR